MDIREFQTADEILSEEINYKLFLHGQEREAVLNAMLRFKKLKQPKSLVTRVKHLFNKNKYGR